MNTYRNSAAHAIVIGSSIAGLTAARVLADHCEQVTIVERDQFSDSADYRRGVPQARHAHTLMPQGQMTLERLFPGLVAELIEQGAVVIDNGRDVALYEAGAWQRPKQSGLRDSISSSRPLLERALYRRVAALSNITLMSGYEVMGLLATEDHQSVTGLRIRNRQDRLAAEMILTSEIVVDTSGRRSKAPQWLAALGHQPPEEWRINPQVGYATRIYRRPENGARNWKKLYIPPTPPADKRGGIIIPMENGRWHVTLIGVCGDYPPTTDEQFLDFAASLATPSLYEAIKDAEPLTTPSGFRRTTNRMRRYDTLPSYLEGFLVMGDAAYALNPMYAQGMTAAVAGTRALDKALQAQQKTNGWATSEGLAQRFQIGLNKVVSRLWQLSTQKDWLWPDTEVEDNTEELTNLMGSNQEQLEPVAA